MVRAWQGRAYIMANGNGNGVSTLVKNLPLIMCVCGLISFGAVAKYRLEKTEESLNNLTKEIRETMLEQNKELARMDKAIDRVESRNATDDANIAQQSARITELSKEVHDVSKQVDRIALKYR